jgi:hypothetical protein
MARRKNISEIIPTYRLTNAVDDREEGSRGGERVVKLITL